MKQLIMVLMMTLISFTTYSQTLGVTSNISTNGASYGFFIEGDENKFGFEFQRGATLNLDYQEVEQYLNGEISSYTAGSSFYNIGAYAILPSKSSTNFLIGGGIQNEEEITTSHRNSSKMNIYLNAGFKTHLDDLISFRGGYQYSPTGISSVLVGVGFTF
jgi:hypothetical protein